MPPPVDATLHPPAVLNAYHAAPNVQAGEHADVHSFRAERGSGADFASPGDVDEPRLGRRLSKRQMEKARAGESAAGVDDGERDGPPAQAVQMVSCICSYR